MASSGTTDSPAQSCEILAGDVSGDQGVAMHEPAHQQNTMAPPISDVLQSFIALLARQIARKHYKSSTSVSTTRSTSEGNRK